jgi:thiol:disulfide interchange protein DsbC
LFPLLPAARLLRALAASALAAAAFAAAAGEAEIRKNLPANVPQLPAIDEVTRTPVAGLWEVRMGTEVIYTDDQGAFVIQGEIYDAKERRNLTAERIDKLTAIDFAQLPLKDAIVWKSGNGKRRVAVFADPNCGYCKRLERDLQKVKDVTVYTFVIPILGGDSPEKSRDIWCAKNNTNAWREWMLEGTPPPEAPAKCDDAAIARNSTLAKKHRVSGTPAVVFEDGSRAPGAIPAAEVERRLVKAATKS